jgi:hypothetical protein
MALYERNSRTNITAKLLDLGMKPDFDGKIRLDAIVDEHTPWIAGKVSPERDCNKWLHYYFKYFNLIPWQCTSCWKIFYNPKTLEELFRVYKMQQEEREFGTTTGWKCGMERRYFTGNKGGYAAFWYNPLFCGLNQARHNLKIVREKLGTSEVQLKRGCTEMEIWTKKRLGKASDCWSELVGPVSLDLQRKLDEVFVKEGFIGSLTEEYKQVVQNRWIENAARHSKVSGDMSYKKYLDRDSDPVEALELYGDSIHRANDYAGAKNGRNYLINLVGRREASKHFGNEDTGDGLLVPELEKKE